MSPSTVEIELFCPHCQQLTSNHNRHDGKDSGQWNSISNNSYWPYLFKADQCDLPSLGFFEILSPRWRSLAFRYTRESRDKVHSFNFFDILKRLKNEHKNANEKAGLKMRNDNQLCEKQLSLFNFFCSLKVTFQQWKVLKLRYSSKIYTVLAYIFFKTFSLCIIKSDLFIVRPAVCKRLHALKV